MLSNRDITVLRFFAENPLEMCPKYFHCHDDNGYTCILMKFSEKRRTEGRDAKDQLCHSCYSHSKKGYKRRSEFCKLVLTTCGIKFKQ
jgi:hypothetical protein